MSTLDASRAGESGSLARVLHAIATVCRTPVEALGPDTRPADVKGWDSFGRLQVVLELERQVGRELPLERAVASESAAALAAVLDETSP